MSTHNRITVAPHPHVNVVQAPRRWCRREQQFSRSTLIPGVRGAMSLRGRQVCSSLDRIGKLVVDRHGGDPSFFRRVVHVRSIVCAHKLITPVRSMRICSCACQGGSYARETKRCVLRKLPPPMARLSPFRRGSDQGAWSGEGLGVAKGRPDGVQLPQKLCCSTPTVAGPKTRAMRCWQLPPMMCVANDGRCFRAVCGAKGTPGKVQ